MVSILVIIHHRRRLGTISTAPVYNAINNTNEKYREARRNSTKNWYDKKREEERIEFEKELAKPKYKDVVYLNEVKAKKVDLSLSNKIKCFKEMRLPDRASYFGYSACLRVRNECFGFTTNRGGCYYDKKGNRITTPPNPILRHNAEESDLCRKECKSDKSIITGTQMLWKILVAQSKYCLLRIYKSVLVMLKQAIA